MKDFISKLASLSAGVKSIIVICCLLVVAVPVAVIIQDSVKQPAIIETTTKKENQKTTTKEEENTIISENSILTDKITETETSITKNIQNDELTTITNSTTIKQESTNNKTNTTTTKQSISDDIKKYYPFGVSKLTYLGTKNGRVYYAGRMGYADEYNCVNCKFCFYDYDEITDWYCYTCYWNGLNEQNDRVNAEFKEKFIQTYGCTKEEIANEYKAFREEYGEHYALQMIEEKYPGKTGSDGSMIALNSEWSYYSLNTDGELYFAGNPYIFMSQADFRVKNSTDCSGCGAHIKRGDNFHCPWCGGLQEELDTMIGTW